MPNVPALIMGVNYSWQNATIYPFGVPVYGISKIKIQEKQEKTNNYGWGAKPISRSYGNYEYEASLSLYFDEIAKIQNAASNRDILSVPFFDFPMTLFSDRVGFRKITILAAEFLETNFETSQGDTKIIVEVPLIIGGIEW